MLLKKQRLKTAIIGTTALAIFSTFLTDIAQAQRNYKGTTRPGFRYASDFILRTGVTDDAPSINLGFFDDGIGDYQITDNINSSAPVRVPGSRRPYLDLRSIIQTSLPPQLNNSFPFYNIFAVSGPIYEYTFEVDPNFPLGNLAPQGPPPLGFDNTLKWYVPSKFTYGAGIFTFDVNNTFDKNGNKVSLLNSLSGLNAIFRIASTAGVTKIAFPSQIPLTAGSGGSPDCCLSAVEFETIPIPETNPSTALVVLGLAGGFIVVRRKAVDDRS